MEKKALVVVILAVLAVAIIALFATGTIHGLATLPQQENTIKIGILLPLTGDATSWALEIRNGIDLAFDEIRGEKINEKQIELIFEDDQCDGKTAATAFKKLTEIDNAKIISGIACSSVALAIAPTAEEKRILVLSATASNPKISDSGDFIFRVWPSDSLEASKLAELAFDKLKTKRIGILHLNNDYCVGLKDAFSEFFAKKGGSITAIQSFETGSGDFKTELLKIKDLNPEAIYIASNPAEMPLILKQVKELGLRQLILANSAGIETKEILEDNKELAEGVVYAIPEKQSSSEFKRKYLAKFNAEPPMLANYGFDVIMLLNDGLKHCQSDSPECIRDYLYSVQNYQGAAGLISFDSKGDVDVPTEIKTIKDGKPAAYSAG